MEYRPTAGTPVEQKPGTLVVKSNAGDIPEATVVLEAAGSSCALEIGSKKLEFRNNGTQAVSIQNRGNKRCTLKGVALSGR